MKKVVYDINEALMNALTDLLQQRNPKNVKVIPKTKRAWVYLKLYRHDICEQEKKWTLPGMFLKALKTQRNYDKVRDPEFTKEVKIMLVKDRNAPRCPTEFDIIFMPEPVKDYLEMLAFTKLRYYVMNALGYYARPSIWRTPGAASGP